MDGRRVLCIGTAMPAAAGSLERLPGWQTVSRDPATALDEVLSSHYDAVVLESPLPGWTAPELLVEVRRLAPRATILVRLPKPCPADAARLARLGADTVLAPDDDLPRHLDRALRERDFRRPELAAGAGPREEWERLLIGGSHEMRAILHVIRLIAGRRATVLITGETGTGKEVCARALHLAGPRRCAPFVAVNCHALPAGLLEAELFGHVRGAFTGALQSRTGRFEQAHGGTLFLDEIGEIPIDLQAKLLRVLQEREIEKLGSSETIRVDLRVVAATNCDLARRIEQGRFREDLYYRLNVVPIHMPPLRQRRADIPLLAAHFVEKICRIEQIQLKCLAGEALERLCGYYWPGNVRQLENAVEMAVALSGDCGILTAVDFPLSEPGSTLAPLVEMPLVSVPDGGLDYERTLAGIERSILEQALRKTGGNKKAAAEMLRLKRTTLSAKVRNLAPPPPCN
jgi:DNA-binding NtrC family response regulator